MNFKKVLCTDTVVQGQRDVDPTCSEFPFCCTDSG